MDFQTFVKRHYFWILFGVAILVVPVGWWMGTSSLAAKTKSRISEIESAENGIPNPQSNPSDFPNLGWTEKVTFVNGERTGHHYDEAKQLHEMQKGVMVWPEAVAHAMHDIPFFQDGKGVAANRARSTYADVYVQEARSIYELVRPIKQNATTGAYEGLVEFGFLDPGEAGNNGAGGAGRRVGTGSPMGMRDTGSGGAGGGADSGVFPRVSDTVWSARAPTFREMWKAQLDLWLLKSLLQSINRVNEKQGAKSIYDASIVQIKHISLHGGNRKALKEALAASGENSDGDGTDGGSNSTGLKVGAGGAGGSSAGFVGPSGGTGGNGLMSGSRGSGNDAATPAGRPGSGSGAGGSGPTGDIPLPSPPAIFGPEQPDGAESSSSEGEGEGGGDTGDTAPGGTSSGSYPAAAGGGPTGMGSGGTDGGQQGGSNKISPWVDNDPEMPFKTRGFMLKVLMKRSDVTLLIQELTDAKVTRFPIEILWLNAVDKDVDHKGEQVVNRYDGTTGAGGGFGSTGMGDGGSAQVPGMPGASGSGSNRFVGPSGAAGNRYPASAGAKGGASGTAGGQSTGLPYQAALNDSSLGYVVIAGVMTVYTEPKKPEVDPSAANNNTANNNNANNNGGNAANNGDGSKTGNPDGKQNPKKTPGFISPGKKNPKTATGNTTGKKAGATTKPANKTSDFKKGQSNPPTKKAKTGQPKTGNPKGNGDNKQQSSGTTTKAK